MERTGAGQVRRLPDTDADGRNSFGMTLVLLASTMTFGGLLLLYAQLRSGAPDWSAHHGAQLALGATAAVLFSSLTLHAGVRAVLRARPRALGRWLGATIALGLAFLALELRLLVLHGSDGFGHGRLQAAAFCVLVGFHLCHVSLALGLLCWLVPGARRERYHANNHVRVRLVARFWHFLGLNWALLYLALFLW